MGVKIMRFILLTSLIHVHVIVIGAISFEADTAITASEANVLNKFRELVRPNLSHKYMEERIFLIKWLRARNFDVVAAEKMLMKHIQWRAENRMDNIDDEDWQDFEVEYPWNLDGVDKEGRPLVQILLKDWDIRKAMLTGRRNRFTRWIYKYFEDGSKLVRKFQNEGKNVTQFSLVMDAEGFNPVTHGCPSCIPIYLTIASAYEEQYPGQLDKIHVINTPEFFRVIIRLVWPALSKDTRKALKLYGTDRKSWRTTLSKAIRDDQLLPAFGGTMKAE